MLHIYQEARWEPTSWSLTWIWEELGKETEMLKTISPKIGSQGVVKRMTWGWQVIYASIQAELYLERPGNFQLRWLNWGSVPVSLVRMVLFSYNDLEGNFQNDILKISLGSREVVGALRSCGWPSLEVLKVRLEEILSNMI